VDIVLFLVVCECGEEESVDFIVVGIARLGKGELHFCLIEPLDCEGRPIELMGDGYFVHEGNIAFPVFVLLFFFWL